MTDDERDNAGVIAPPPLIYLSALALGLLIDRRFRAPLLPRGLPRGAGRAVGWPLVASGVSLGGWFYRTMRRAGNQVDPNRPVSRLVTGGPFRYSRNPGYLAQTMIFAGIAILRDALWTMLLLPAVTLVIRRGVIDREERYLERRFGEEYLLYKSRVRRWI